MSARRFRQRILAWLAAVALVASPVAAPLAHAAALPDALLIGMDICSVAERSTEPRPVALLGAPRGDSDHAAHGDGCPLCAGASSPAAVSPRPPLPVLGEVESPAPPWVARVLLHPRLPSLDGRPRAPPFLA